MHLGFCNPRRIQIAPETLLYYIAVIDKIDYGLYPNVILMLCSNSSIDEINNLDDSYLREGRIDLIQNLIKV